METKKIHSTSYSANCLKPVSALKALIAERSSDEGFDEAYLGIRDNIPQVILPNVCTPLFTPTRDPAPLEFSYI